MQNLTRSDFEKLDELDAIHTRSFPNNIFVSIEHNNKIMVFSDHDNPKEVLLHTSKSLKLPVSSFGFYRINEIPRLKNNKIDFSQIRAALK